MKPQKILTHSAHSDNCYFHFFLSIAWVEILWGFKKFFFKKMLTVSVFYLEKQKSFIPKKKSKPLSISKQKKTLFTDPIFSDWRFWFASPRSESQTNLIENWKNVSHLFQSVANSQTDDTEQEITSLKTRVSFLFYYLLLYTKCRY